MSTNANPCRYAVGSGFHQICLNALNPNQSKEDRVRTLLSIVGRVTGSPCVVLKLGALKDADPAPRNSNESTISWADDRDGALSTDNLKWVRRPIFDSDGERYGFIYLRFQAEREPYWDEALLGVLRMIGAEVSGFVREQRISALEGRLADASDALAWSQTASHLFHEVGNVASALGLQLSLIRKDTVPASERAKLDRICAASDQLRKVIHQAKSQWRNPAHLSLEEEIELVSLLRHIREVYLPPDFSVSIQGECEGVELDRIRVVSNRTALIQILTNLVSNAMDALQGTPAPRILLRARDCGDHLRIDVADNGPGIPDSIRPGVFGMKLTTKPGKGSGLGLSITRGLVEKLEGRIWFESTEEGTTFSIRLPKRENAKT